MCAEMNFIVRGGGRGQGRSGVRGESEEDELLEGAGVTVSG